MNSIKLFTIAIAMLPLFSYAQSSDSKVHIRINANVDGKNINIDTSIDNTSDFDLNEYLNSLGLGEEMTQLNIGINSDNAMQFNFDQEALENMIDNIQNIELPEMPEMPEMAAMAPLGNYSFSNGNKAYLGVMSESVEKNNGVRITEVMDSTAAFHAGLKEGDIITKIDDKTVESPNNLIEILSAYEAGDKVTITYTRDGKMKTASAELQENKQYSEWEQRMEGLNGLGEGLNDFGDEMRIWGDSMRENFSYEEKGFLGVTIEDMDDKDGVQISEIVEGSAAEAAGLKEGDIINTIDNIVMKNYEDVVKTISAKKPGEVIHINYTRDGKSANVDAALKGSNTWIWKGDEEGRIWDAPNAPPMPGSINVYACPSPVDAYSYSMSNGKNTINMSISIVKDAVAPTSKNGSSASGSLIDPETIQFYPNPSTGIFTLKFALDQNGDTEITIRDVSGIVVYSEELSGFQGSYEKTIDLGKAAKGTYIINVKQNDYTATKQIVLQ